MIVHKTFHLVNLPMKVHHSNIYSPRLAQYPHPPVYIYIYTGGGGIPELAGDAHAHALDFTWNY